MKKRVGVLISGRGSNLRSLIAACAAADFPAEIVLVISNIEGAGGLEHARSANIPTRVIPHTGLTRESFDAKLDAALREADVEIVCLAGFMRILSDGFARAWAGRLLNIHPSLLPDFRGTLVHERVIEAGVAQSGATVHYVAPELDAGPMVAQETVPVHPGDTAQTLAARVLEAEHRLYPAALRLVADGKVRLENGLAVISD